MKGLLQAALPQKMNSPVPLSIIGKVYFNFCRTVGAGDKRSYNEHNTNQPAA